MFIIRELAEGEDRQIEWPVTVEIAIAGGKTRKYEFTGIFRVLTQDESVSLAEEASEYATAQAAAGSKRSHLDALHFFGHSGVLIDWKQVCTPDKTPVPYSVEKLETALTGPDGTAFAKGLWAAQTQIRVGAKAKN